MKKKSIGIVIGIILGVIVLTIILVILQKKNNTSYTPLMQLEKYNQIKLDKIKTINIMKYTKEETESIYQDQKSDIKKTYNELTKYEVGKETEEDCYEEKTIYVLEFENEEPVTIEIHCNSIRIDGKNYKVKR